MPTYSHSQLSMYEDCPLKYKLCHRDRIKREGDSVEAFLGSRVHETLKKCYDDLRLTKLNSLKDLLEYYHKAWQENWHDAVAVSKPDLTPEHYRALGERLIKNYYHNHAPFDADTTIDTEMRLSFSLDDENKYRLSGYIDRLSKAKDGFFEIHDYKTSAHLPGQKQADEDRQLGLYHIGVQKKWPNAQNIRLVWHYLAHDTALVSYRTPEAISSLIASTRELINTIESDTEFPPRESPLCQWCEYPDLCPRRKHICLVDALPANEYLTEPGVTLVNKYAALKAQSQQIEAEMDLVKEALLEYALREGVEVIKGSDCKATVKFDEKLKFPGKNDAERPGLDAVIRKARKWDEVSQLDTTTLTRIVEDGLWDSGLINQVMKYGRIEETSSVRISKLKEQEK